MDLQSKVVGSTTVGDFFTPLCPLPSSLIISGMTAHVFKAWKWEGLLAYAAVCILPLKHAKIDF